MTDSRRLGVTIPLFSLRTTGDFGIGNIPALATCARWLASAGVSLIQVLPPHELGGADPSPYGAVSAFGLDPIFIDLGRVEEVDDALVARALGPDFDARRRALEAAPQVDYDAVRDVKRRVLAAAFERFEAEQLRMDTPRAAALRRFVEDEREWAHDLALYAALKLDQGHRAWTEWDEPLRNRHEDALRSAAERHARSMLEHHYQQWVAFEQWQSVRRELAASGVALMGDLPFVVCRDSADVWAHAALFRAGASLGAPPDAFSPDGQDWGLPPYDWQALEATDYAWLRARARHAARLYDCFRLDHAVGFFRMYVRWPDGGRGFDPMDEDAQRELGRRVLSIVKDEAAPAEVVAEDLGVVPDFVRHTLRELGIPGYRVIPWERDGTLRRPSEFPANSVATFSTHDTHPLAGWWPHFSDHERAELCELAGVPQDAPDAERYDKLVELLMGAGSNLVLLLAPEVLGQASRINTPGTMDPSNWTYRLPRAMNDLAGDEVISSRLIVLREAAARAGRVPAASQ